MICVNIYMINCVWNTRVRKYDLRGSKNIVNMKIQKLNCIVLVVGMCTTS